MWYGVAIKHVSGRLVVVARKRWDADRNIHIRHVA
jgi:hypothetical protein